MAPQYKLSYFDMSGAAEPIRLIFAYAKVEFEDHRIQRENWPAIKPTTPWGQVPVLEVDGQKIAQSAAIARFLSRRFGLVGETEMDHAKCDEYVDALKDAKQEAIGFLFQKDETRKAELKKKFTDDTLPTLCQRFTNILERNGSGFLIGKKLTYADILLAHSCDSMGKFTSTEPLEKFPVLKKHQSMVFNLSGIKEWIAKRPQ